MNARSTQRRSSRFRAALLLIALTLLLAEVTARVLVATQWTDDKIEGLTRLLPARGRYASDPSLPYVLAPGLTALDRNTNSRGWRGPEFDAAKRPGVTRIVCIGASTTYGWDVLWEHTWPARLQAMLSEGDDEFEVLNAGVPGYVSTEVVEHFQRHVLPTDPDVVVFYGGRNDVFPQGYNRYSADYTHYRRRDYSIEQANSAHKRLFAVSHLAMVLCTWRGDRFGWSSINHNPVHGSLRRENRPTPEEFTRNIGERGRGDTFTAQLNHLTELCAARGAELVLVQIPVRPDMLATGSLDHDDRFKAPFGEQVTRNNAAVRRVAELHGLPLIDATALTQDADLFMDDCHMTADGHYRFAQLAARAILAARDR